MVFLVQRDCPCCQKATRIFEELIRTKGLENITMPDMAKANWHCQDCWNKYHNNFSDGKSDWLNYKEYCKKHGIVGTK